MLLFRASILILLVAADRSECDRILRVAFVVGCLALAVSAFPISLLALAFPLVFLRLALANDRGVISVQTCKSLKLVAEFRIDEIDAAVT